MSDEQTRETETMDSYMRDPWACYEDDDADCADFSEEDSGDCGCCCCCE